METRRLALSPVPLREHCQGTSSSAPDTMSSNPYARVTVAADAAEGPCDTIDSLFLWQRESVRSAFVGCASGHATSCTAEPGQCRPGMAEEGSDCGLFADPRKRRAKRSASAGQRCLWDRSR